MPAEVMRSAAVIVVVIGLWETGVVPKYFTSIIFFFLAVTLAGVPPSVVFSGFYSSAVWLVFGGLVIGFAVQTTGLGSKIATTLLGYYGGAYFGIIARTVIAAALMAFVLPSNVGMALVTSWTMTLFPYELPPMIVATQLGGLRTGQIMRLMPAMVLLAWLVILPLQFV